MNWKQPKVYAIKHKDEATRAASRSGGIFTALSDQVLSDDGVVYGCVLTDKFDAMATICIRPGIWRYILHTVIFILSKV